MSPVSWIFSKNWPSGLIQSLSRDDRILCVCLCYPVDWRLLVEEHIANIGVPKIFSGFCCFDHVLVF